MLKHHTVQLKEKKSPSVHFSPRFVIISLPVREGSLSSDDFCDVADDTVPRNSNFPGPYSLTVMYSLTPNSHGTVGYSHMVAVGSWVGPWSTASRAFVSLGQWQAGFGCRETGEALLSSRRGH